MDPGTVIGYFSQDVGESVGRTALQEVLQGAGQVYELETKARAILDRLGIAESRQHLDKSNFSGGWKSSCKALKAL